MSDTKTVQSGGIGVAGLLGVAFILLKILAIQPVASWSWWWVTAPFWGPFVAAFAFVALAAVFLIAKALITGR